MPAERTRAVVLAIEEDVLGDVERRDDRQELVDGLDAGRSCMRRGLEGVRQAVERDLAAVRTERPRDHVDERRLARAVVAHEADDLAAAELQADLVQRTHGAEVLADASHLEDRRRVCGPGHLDRGGHRLLAHVVAAIGWPPSVASSSAGSGTIARSSRW